MRDLLTDIQILDANGLSCPLPVLRARKRLRQLDAGMILEIYVTDPAAPSDFRAFCKETGNVLISITKIDGQIVIRIQKC